MTTGTTKRQRIAAVELCAASASPSGSWLWAIRRAIACALVSAAASCDTTSSPDAYTRLTIEPRELNIAVGVSGPLRLAYFATTAAGDRDSVPPRAVAISARDPFYAEVRNDSIFAHRFGGTYLRAEYRPASGGRLRDSIPIIVFEVR